MALWAADGQFVIQSKLPTLLQDYWVELASSEALVNITTPSGMQFPQRDAIAAGPILNGKGCKT